MNLAIPRLVLIVLLGSLLACASQQPSEFYRLTAISVKTTDSALPAGISIGIGPVHLPSELDRPGLVSERGDSGLVIADFDLWAGDFDEMFTRTSASLLARRLGVDAVYPEPWDTRQRPQYQFRFEVERFSGELGGEVVLEVMWTLTEDRGRDKLLMNRSRFVRSANGRSYMAYVDAMNQLLADFTGELASQFSTVLQEKTLSE